MSYKAKTVVSARRDQKKGRTGGLTEEQKQEIREGECPLNVISVLRVANLTRGPATPSAALLSPCCVANKNSHAHARGCAHWGSCHCVPLGFARSKSWWSPGNNEGKSALTSCTACSCSPPACSF